MDYVEFNQEHKSNNLFSDLDTQKLKPMKKLKILCGKKHGLPFDYLMTDIMSGCLNANHICYGNCTAALYWLNKGYDFGKNIINELDEKMFEKSIKDLPKEQKWIRQGWMSDCSLSSKSWDLVVKVSEILNKYNISLMIITKIHYYPSEMVMKKLANKKVEIRVSLSALDSLTEIQKRLKFLNEYKTMGGIAVPYLMTAKFKNNILKNNQEYIVKYIVDNDFIAGEHPLRISINNPLIKDLEGDGYYHPKYQDQYWFGRILNNINNFILPPPTHLKPEYSLEFITFSSILTKKNIKGIENNLPTYEDLKNNNYTKEMFDHATYSMQKN